MVHRPSIPAQIISTIAALSQAQAGILLFFSLCTLGLLLGDGKQPVINVVAAVFLLVMYAVTLRSRPRQSLPPALLLPWYGLLAYLFVRTGFSDSVGISVVTTVKVLLGFLTFSYFYRYIPSGSLRFFCDALLLFALVAICASGLLVLFPSLTQYLPLMNLLYPTYGHNHLVDILLLSFPVAIYQFHRAPTRFYLATICLHLLGVVLSHSLGAGILISLFLFFVFRSLSWSRLTSPVRRGLIVGIAVCLLAIPAGRLLYQPGTPVEKSVSGSIGNRIAYWQQAVKGARDAPLWGSGPGTFSLLSKRYQHAPSSFSWFAHNYPLQIISEIGLVGGLCMLVLAWSVYRRIGRVPHGHPDAYLMQALGWSLFLTLGYSLYEYNIEYTIVWLLVWAIAGQLMKGRNPTPGRSSRYGEFCLLAVLAVFYVSAAASLLIDAWRGPLGSRSSLLVAPYSTLAAGTYLDAQAETAQPPDAVMLGLLTYFHRRDPEINHKLGLTLLSAGDDRGLEYLAQAADDDPYSREYQTQLLAKLRDRGRMADLGNRLERMAALYIPPAARPLLREARLSDPLFHPFYSLNPLAGLDDNAVYFPDKFATLFYQLGSYVRETDPTRTGHLWALAAATAPGWSYFHIELASLQAFVFNDDPAAAAVLQQCRQFPDAREHCSQFTPATLLPPGTLAPDIFAIPATLQQVEVSPLPATP